MSDPISTMQSLILPPTTAQTAELSYLERIPVELMRRIISLATGMPRSLDTSATTPFDFSEVETGDVAFMKLLDQNMDTKRKIMAVHRKLFELIEDEFYYEFLFLSDMDVKDLDGSSPWYLFAPGLEADRVEKEAVKRRGKGWYVKRLEITTAIGLAADGVDKLDAMSTVLGCCPNVELLTLGVDAPPRAGGDKPEDEVVTLPTTGVIAVDLVPYPLFNALFPSPHRNRYTLRKLVWNSNIIQATNRLISYLPTLVNLESFHINLRAGYISSPIAANIRLERLHTLEIVSTESDPSTFLGVVATWKLDRVIQLKAITTIGIANPMPCFQAHGSKLLTLNFSSLGSHNGPAILRLCTALKDIIIHLRWAPTHVLRLESKTVKRIGIRGAGFRNIIHFSDDLNSLFTCFQQILTPLMVASASPPIPSVGVDIIEPPLPISYPCYFRSLQIVRLLDFDSVLFRKRKWLSKHVEDWAFWEKSFEKLGIRLENHKGELIKIPSDTSEVNMWLEGDRPSINYGYK